MLDSEELEKTNRLSSIFMPYATGRWNRVRSDNKRFVHYSSAENIYKIISSKTMWLRNTKGMADYSEVEIGYGMLHSFFTGNREEFYAAVNQCSPNLGEESLALFDQWWADIRFNTYI